MVENWQQLLGGGCPLGEYSEVGDHLKKCSSLDYLLGENLERGQHLGGNFEAGGPHLAWSETALQEHPQADLNAELLYCYWQAVQLTAQMAGRLRLAKRERELARGLTSCGMALEACEGLETGLEPSQYLIDPH